MATTLPKRASSRAAVSDDAAVSRNRAVAFVPDAGVGRSGGRGPRKSPLRLTRQRRVVFDAIRLSDDHPTASELFHRVQRRLPSISLATVYNCLDTLSAHGWIRQVNVDRAATRYCLNDRPHGHFHCDCCGKIIDIEAPGQDALRTTFQLPRAVLLSEQEINLRGLCPECATRSDS